MRILALVFLALGVLCLVYRGFDRTKEKHEAKVGPFEIAVVEKERVNVPVWAGVGLVATGVGILLMRKK